MFSLQQVTSYFLLQKLEFRLDFFSAGSEQWLFSRSSLASSLLGDSDVPYYLH